MERYNIKFAPNQKLPDGYKIQWLESVEHYVWVNDKGEESVIFADRWAAFRCAWANER